MCCRTHRPINDSIIFDTIDVSEIGGMSIEIALGGHIFRIGTTFARFLTDGTSPALIDALNIEHTGSARNTENSFRNQLGNSSGPLDLRASIWLNFDSTSKGSIIYSNGHASLTLGIKSVLSGVRSADTLCMKVLFLLAIRVTVNVDEWNVSVKWTTSKEDYVITADEWQHTVAQ